MNPLGLLAATTTFLAIWLGHVSVRKIEFASPTIWKPATVFAMFGIFLESLSLFATNRALSVLFGIAGISLLWDALEFIRQQKRIMLGHAPANPKNARHRKIMAEYSSATTVDLLKRDPTGGLASLEEAASVTEHQ